VETHVPKFWIIQVTWFLVAVPIATIVLLTQDRINAAWFVLWTAWLAILGTTVSYVRRLVLEEQR
jgi:hypothetical protein